MKTLITGGAGFIGSHLSEALLCWAASAFDLYRDYELRITNYEL